MTGDLSAAVERARALLAPAADPELAGAALQARASLGNRAAIRELMAPERSGCDTRYDPVRVAPAIYTYACEACHRIVRGPKARCKGCGHENYNAQAIR